MINFIKMDKGLLFVALLMVNIESAYSIDYTKPMPEREFAFHSSVVKSQSCFEGIFGDYNMWRNALTARAGVSEKSFLEKFPYTLYQDFKENLSCFNIIYKVDDYLVKGIVIFPKRETISQLPAIIYNRGGNNTKVHTLKFGDLFATLFPLAKSGHVVIASQYGGAMLWSKGNKQINGGIDEFGGQELQDVFALLPILDAMPNVNSQRVGMMGWSRGSMMTLLAVKESARIKSIVLGGSAVDLVSVAKERPVFERKVLERLIPNYKENRKLELRQRSATYWPEKIPKSTSILMLHGERDTATKLEYAKLFYEKLKNNGVKQIEFITYPNGSHSLREYQDEVTNTVINWFADTL
ncbi:hypothetical protein EAG18_20090 [Pseudoalteromonas sp. J010]|uniref:alpha/beta hydrolase family protein n=1 Tax=Pseudoalteromonas sp. J010 TaxID=998465 RepID=UPI000F6463D9|nr:prolyl oligopeptidase family serine peptidase [Pseudoalteromonas sp. J010]RRS06845.1 hypothetical protein EAG18_20090 [Pseudoalteromonas sp. J010]